MSDDGPFAVCQGCNGRIDPDDPALVMGIEVRTDLRTFGGPEPPDDGLERLFHPECLRAAPGWRLKQSEED